MWHFLVLLLLLSTGGWAAEPVFVSQVAPDYANMTLADVEFSLPCQYFTDLGGRYISTALPVTVPAGYVYDVLGLQFDFIIGRRPASLSSIMVFDWDGEPLLTAAFGATLLDWQMDCDGRPCDAPQTPSLAPTRIYKDAEYSWGWLYKVDFILPPGAPFTVAAPSLVDNFTLWFNLSVAFPSYDINSGYRYKVMQPVWGGGTGDAAHFALQDPYNLLGHNWTVWTPSSDAIRTTLLGLVPASPVFGHRVAANVRPYDTMIPTPSSSWEESSTPNSNSTEGAVEPPPAPVALQVWHIVMIAAGAVLAFVLLVLLVVLVGRYARRRFCGSRRVIASGNIMDVLYSFPVDGQYNPLEDPDHHHVEPLSPSERSVVLSADDEDGNDPWQMPPGRTTTSEVQWRDDGQGKIANVRQTLGLDGSSSSPPRSPPSVARDDPAYRRDGLQVLTVPPPAGPPPPLPGSDDV